MLVAIAALVGQRRQARPLRLLGQPVRPLRKRQGEGRPPMLTFGVVVLGVTDRARAEEFWCAALGYRVRDDGFGGWARVLEPPGGTGTMIALQLSETPLDDYPRHHLDLHVADAAEQEAEAARLVSLGASRVDWDRYPDDPDFIVLADTEGNRFCIVDLGHEHRPPVQAS
jgi:catechol 2,3-dioxygenase-like lactoylglutathione lyase family enzyme